LEIEELLYQADSFRREGEFEEAIDLYQEVINLINANIEFEYQYASKLYRQLCYCYRKQGETNIAIEMGQQSIKSALKACMKFDQSKESRVSLAYCNMNLGVVYDESKQYEKAVEYYQEGVAILKEYADDDIAVMNSYINALLSIGTSMFYMKRYIESKKIFHYMLECIKNDTNDSRYNYAVEYLKKIYQIGEK